MATYRQLTRWDPLRDLMSLQEDIDRVLGGFRRDRGEVGATGMWTPQLDIHETTDAFVVSVDLPGMTSDDIDVSFDQNLLTIRGERRWETEIKEESFHRMERRFGSFQRIVSLPAHVDPDGIQASVTNGVLEVTVPKAEAAKPRKIKVGEGARQLNA